jgi:DNA (cytosine-5)-methyltransferase 1
MDGLIVDNFAGGGGASLGISQALGREPDIAINHDRRALECHLRNHPRTWHINEDAYHVDPAQVTQGQPVSLAWFSPDCRHFSRAKGSAPVSKSVRGLAWVVVKWARAVKPKLIIMENVREFLTWGPIDDDGMPIKAREGETFRNWFRALKRCGYSIEHKILNAADYGAPTNRRRFFLIARCDGQRIVWPEPTHGPARSKPYRTAAECIDWSIPCPSIFERERPLKDATLRRIAFGIKRFVIDAKEPFIVACNHGSGDRFRGQAIGQPLGTITQSHSHALVRPLLVPVGYGERFGQSPRVNSIDQPLATVVTEQKQALVSAFIVKHFGGVVGVRPDTPWPTITSIGTQNQVVAAHLARCNFDDAGTSLDRPASTITSNNHAALVYSFLIKYFGQSIGEPVNQPLGTVTTKDRFGLVTVTINGEPYVIVDIGMRMLTPRELARAQGFPDSYWFPNVKSHAVKLIGNSVCPVMARTLVSHNLPGRGKQARKPKSFIKGQQMLFGSFNGGFYGQCS